jgi:uncharacterized protein (DUF433 family)
MVRTAPVIVGWRALFSFSAQREIRFAGRGYDTHGAPVANLNPRITVEPGKMGGKPCIRGLRFTVYDLASYLASGTTEEEILTDFPYLEKDDFRAVYEFFASFLERIDGLEASR